MSSSPQGHTSDVARSQQPESANRSNSPRPPSPMSKEAQAKDRLDPLRRKVLRELEGFTDTILYERTRLLYKQQTLNDHHNYIAKSADELIRVVESMVPDSQQHSELKESRSQIQENVDAAKSLYENVKSIGDNVRQLEFRWEKKVGDLATLLDPTSDPELAQAAFSRLETESAVVGSSPTTDTPDLVYQYFDRKGDIGIFLERLDDLRVDYRENRAWREIVADRGEELSVPAEVFENEFADREDKILKDLGKAESDTAELLLRCKAANLDPAEYLKNWNQNESPEFLSNKQSSEARSQEGEHPPAISREYPAQPIPHGDASPPRQPDSQRIQQWLDTTAQPSSHASAQGSDLEENSGSSSLTNAN